MPPEIRTNLSETKVQELEQNDIYNVKEESNSIGDSIEREEYLSRMTDRDTLVQPVDNGYVQKRILQSEDRRDVKKGGNRQLINRGPIEPNNGDMQYKDDFIVEPITDDIKITTRIVTPIADDAEREIGEPVKEADSLSSYLQDLDEELNNLEFGYGEEEEIKEESVSEESISDSTLGPLRSLTEEEIKVDIPGEFDLTDSDIDAINSVIENPEDEGYINPVRVDKSINGEQEEETLEQILDNYINDTNKEVLEYKSKEEELNNLKSSRKYKNLRTELSEIIDTVKQNGVSQGEQLHTDVGMENPNETVDKDEFIDPQPNAQDNDSYVPDHQLDTIDLSTLEDELYSELEKDTEGIYETYKDKETNKVVEENNYPNTVQNNHEVGEDIVEEDLVDNDRDEQSSIDEQEVIDDGEVKEDTSLQQDCEQLTKAQQLVQNLMKESTIDMLPNITLEYESTVVEELLKRLDSLTNIIDVKRKEIEQKIMSAGSRQELEDVFKMIEDYESIDMPNIEL